MLNPSRLMLRPTYLLKGERKFKGPNKSISPWFSGSLTGLRMASTAKLGSIPERENPPKPSILVVEILTISTIPQKMFNPTWFKLIVSSEFIKIKQKQKAWAVDNGLRVHEVKWNFSLLWIFTFDLLCILAEGQWRQVDDDCFPDACGKVTSSVKRIQHYSLASRSIPLKLSSAHSYSAVASAARIYV